MHDNMLQKTEKLLKEQNSNLTTIASTIDELKGKLKKSEEEKQSMEDKLTEVMVNILEVKELLTWPNIMWKAARSQLPPHRILNIRENKWSSSWPAAISYDNRHALSQNREISWVW